MDEEGDVEALGNHPDGADDRIDIRLQWRALAKSSDCRCVVDHDDESLMFEVMAPHSEGQEDSDSL